jgi:hypothetical protein
MVVYVYLVMFTSFAKKLKPQISLLVYGSLYNCLRFPKDPTH